MQKFNIIFVLLVAGWASASPEPLLNLLGGITNIIPAIVKTIGVPTGVATGVVSGANSAASGVVGSALGGGLLSGGSSAANNVTDDDVDSDILSGLDGDLLGGLNGNIIGGLFGALGIDNASLNGGSSGGLLGGLGSGLGGGILSGLNGGLIGGLSTPATLVLNMLTEIVSDIKSGINNITKQFLAVFTDSNIKKALNSATDVIVPVVQFIFDNLNKASSNISAIINEFYGDKNSSLYAVVNQVGAILAPVVDKFNKYYANNSACFEPSRIQLLSFDKPMQECIADSNALFNATDYAEFALAKIEQIAQIAKDVKCDFIECVVPAIISPNDSTARTNAMTCIASIADNILALKPAALAEIKNIVELFKSVLTNGKEWFTDCINEAKDEVVDLVKQVTDSLDKCLK